MKVSDRGIALVAKYEGFRSCPYRDAVGVWTIGYGETQGIGPKTPCWSQEHARARLHARLDEFAEKMAHYVHVPLAQNEYDALASLAYNIGLGALRASTLLRLLNSGDRRGAADQFLVWDKAGGRRLPGLSARRREERALFLEVHETKAQRRIRLWSERLARVRAEAADRKRRGLNPWPAGLHALADRLKRALRREREKK